VNVRPHKSPLHKQVFGLCPACQELAWHDSAGRGFYKCVKCDAVSALDDIFRVIEFERMWHTVTPMAHGCPQPGIKAGAYGGQE
jgi:tRNA(Ile2) C34 agmatinyltransferase TiaS